MTRDQTVPPLKKLVHVTMVHYQLKIQKLHVIVYVSFPSFSLPIKEIKNEKQEEERVSL